MENVHFQSDFENFRLPFVWSNEKKLLDCVAILEIYKMNKFGCNE